VSAAPAFVRLAMLSQDAVHRADGTESPKAVVQSCGHSHQGKGKSLMAQHLENIKVKQFRGLRDLELNRLGPVNLFVGANNSGKTSVLEAIATFCCPFDPIEWLSTARRRETVGGTTQIVRLSSLRWLFPQTIDQSSSGLYHGQTEMHADGAFCVKSVFAQYQEIRGVPDEATLSRTQWRSLPREPDETYQGAELQVKIDAEIDDLFFVTEPTKQLESNFIFWEAAPFFYRPKSPDSFSLPVRTLTPVSHRTERSQIERFSRAALNREVEEVLEPIRQFDSGILGLQLIETGGTSLYVDHKKTGLTPLSVFGDGVRRVIMMALTLPQVKDGVLLIDEIETAIHISVLNKVYQWLFAACQRYNVQLFATTHSLEAVDALLEVHNNAPDHLVCYRLGEPGEPTKRYSSELLARLRSERGLDVR
jgi:hypothetical protein